MNQTIVFWIYDKDEYESEAENTEDVVVHFRDNTLDCSIEPQESVPLDMDEMLIVALREAINIVHSDSPGLEIDPLEIYLLELGEEYSDYGFKITEEIYLKAIELMEMEVQKIDDDEERNGVWDSVIDVFKESLVDVDWETQVVFANT